MAKTFEEYMRDNNLTTGYGPGYLYTKEGGAHDRGQIIRNWQEENNAGTLASSLSQGQGGANPFGGVPAVSQDNRFAAGLTDAESRLRALLDNPDSVQQSAAYKFRVNQGQEALQRSLGAKGLLNSGNRLMELTKYGQDMASQEYDAQYGRLGNLLGNYSQSWIGDKNANTSLFNAQANAWNQAQANADRTKLAWAEFNKPKYAAVRGSSSGTGNSNTAYGEDLFNKKIAPIEIPYIASYENREQGF